MIRSFRAELIREGNRKDTSRLSVLISKKKQFFINSSRKELFTLGVYS